MGGVKKGQFPAFTHFSDTNTPTIVSVKVSRLHPCHCAVSPAERCLITLSGQGLQQRSMAESLNCKKVGQKMCLAQLKNADLLRVKELWGSYMANERSLWTCFSWCKTTPALMSNFAGKHIAHSFGRSHPGSGFALRLAVISQPLLGTNSC